MTPTEKLFSQYTKIQLTELAEYYKIDPINKSKTELVVEISKKYENRFSKNWDDISNGR